MKAGLISCLTGVVAAASAPCRFARSFTCESFVSNRTSLDVFLDQVVAAESAFHSPGVGYEPNTAFTYDGHPLNYSTGQLAGQVHNFSAASKESLHLGLLALAIEGDYRALTFIGGKQNALSLLEKKITAYEGFNASYQGYGCFLPWVAITPSGIQPNPDWVGRVPGLDNGEMVWSIFAVTLALERRGDQPNLARRYRAWFQCMAQNAKTIFYMGSGGLVSSVVDIVNMSAPVTPANYNQSTGGYLNDPYEGETLTVLLDLFAQWDNATEREQLWIAKRPLLQAVNYTLPASSPVGAANVTVQRGWWFSSHEQWKTLLLPYFDSPLVQSIFANCEKARTWDAAVTGQPGLLASVNDVTSGSLIIPDYIGATGIASIAFQPIDRRDVVTPYGAWALMLHNASIGACWYRNMLAAPRMQGPYGSTEAVSTNGSYISPLTTWDSKITTVMGIVGGVKDIVARGLRAVPDAPLASTADKLSRAAKTAQAGSAYDRFMTVIEREHSLAFPVVAGVNAPYAVPQVAVPAAAPDWDCWTA